MKRKSIRTWIASTAATLGLVGAAVVSSAGTASAASNGQQILFRDSIANIYSIYVYGSNQNGQWVGHCFPTPATDNYLSGWWWKGTVQIYFLTGSSHNNCNGSDFSLYSGASVPTYQANSDYYTIDDQRWLG
ncbi:hypothetical protein [Streptomyces sp. NPDC021020]|uniref:hypothetical protein n=1 Tax=Streptomyces sp. NPDC021020 TaxID=3365109 RepID=UPI0037B1DDC2